MPHDTPREITQALWNYTIPLLLDIDKKGLAHRLVEDRHRPLEDRLRGAIEAIRRRRKAWATAIEEASDRAMRVYHMVREQQARRRGRKRISELREQVEYGQAVRCALQEIPMTRLPSGSGTYDRGADPATLARDFAALRTALATSKSQRDLDKILAAIFPDAPPRVPFDDEARAELRKGPATAAAYLLHKATGRSVSYILNLVRRAARRRRALEDARKVKALLGLGDPPPLIHPKRRPRKAPLK